MKGRKLWREGNTHYIVQSGDQRPDVDAHGDRPWRQRGLRQQVKSNREYNQPILTGRANVIAGMREYSQKLQGGRSLREWGEELRRSNLWRYMGNCGLRQTYCAASIAWHQHTGRRHCTHLIRPSRELSLTTWASKLERRYSNKLQWPRPIRYRQERKQPRSARNQIQVTKFHIFNQSPEDPR